MPRLRDTVDPMTRLLIGYEISGNKLAKELGCAPRTAVAKIHDPDKLTLGDLRVIHIKFGVPVDEMRERILKC